jgi:hypothetical protein
MDNRHFVADATKSQTTKLRTESQAGAAMISGNLQLIPVIIRKK